MNENLKCPNCDSDKYTTYGNAWNKHKEGHYTGHKFSTKYICLRCGTVFGVRYGGDVFIIASHMRIK